MFANIKSKMNEMKSSFPSTNGGGDDNHGDRSRSVPHAGDPPTKPKPVKQEQRSRSSSQHRSVGGKLSNYPHHGVSSSNASSTAYSKNNKLIKIKTVSDAQHYLSPPVDHLNTVPLWFYPCHIVAAIFQYMQSFILFAFSKEVTTRAPVYTNFNSEYNVLSPSFGIPNPIQTGEINMTLFSGICVLLAAIDHTITVIPYFRPKYEYYLKRNQSPYRWIEFSISASIMRVQVAQIAGVSDKHLLISIFFLSSCCILFGMIHEPLNARALAEYGEHEFNFFGLWFSFIPHLVTWSIIYCYFITGLMNGEEPPGYVGTILFALFVLDGSFAVNFICQWKRIGSYYKDYVFGEFIFIMLSFTAKTFLAWITYGSVNSGKLNGGI